MKSLIAALVFLSYCSTSFAEVEEGTAEGASIFATVAVCVAATPPLCLLTGLITIAFNADDKEAEAK